MIECAIFLQGLAQQWRPCRFFGGGDLDPSSVLGLFVMQNSDSGAFLAQLILVTYAAQFVNSLHANVVTCDVRR